MSLVVAIKDKNRIVVGSDKQCSTGFNKDHTATKVWEVADLPDAVMGSVGSVRASQVVQYNKIVDLNDISERGLDTSFMINSLVPNILACLKGNGVTCTQEDKEENISIYIPNVFLFAYQDKAWVIWNDLSVSEVENYIAIGSGSDVANGALFATPDKNPFERIVTSIDAAAETTLFVDNGVDLVATKECPTDMAQIKKALGYVEIEEEKEPKKSTKSTKKEEKKKK